jgi:hypothetical protein
MSDGFGPPITVRPSVLLDPTAQTTDVPYYEMMSMERLVPRFDQYGPELKTLSAAVAMPAPDAVAASDPETIDFLFEVPGVEPGLSFEDFIRGAAIATRTIDNRWHNAIRDALISVGQSVIDGGMLPTIDVDFYDSFKVVERTIFANGESVSWKPLIAFTEGAYWLLSFVQSPERRRGSMSPLEFVERRVMLSASLGYVPR